MQMSSNIFAVISNYHETIYNCFQILKTYILD